MQGSEFRNGVIEDESDIAFLSSGTHCNLVREDRHGQGSNDFGPCMDIGEEINDLWVKNEELDEVKS